jgi:hypothetical protein
MTDEDRRYESREVNDEAQEAQARRDALIRQLHDLGKEFGEISVTVFAAGLDTHMGVAEFHDPLCRDVVIAEATTQPDGQVAIEEIWVPTEALEAVGHAILRALAKSPI